MKLGKPMKIAGVSSVVGTLFLLTACQSNSAPGGADTSNGEGESNLAAQLRMATMEQGGRWLAHLRRHPLQCLA